jgi:hypothetical protein
MLDAGGFSQGEHVVEVYVLSVNGTYNSDPIKTTFMIDNTPEVAIICQVEDMDGTVEYVGTVSFKERVNGTDGSLSLFVKIDSGPYYLRGTKSYDGKGISWTYSEITGSKLQIFSYEGMELTLKATATASNGANKSAEYSVGGEGCPSGFSSAK